MKIKILIYFLFSLPYFNSSAQVIFQRTIGTKTAPEVSFCIKLNSDSGFIISGYCQYYDVVNTDVYLTRTDKYGDTLWTRTYGGPLIDYGMHTQQTLDGGFIVGGYTNSFGAGGYDMYLIKTDPSGNFQWSKTYGDTLNELGVSVQQLSDSGYIFIGNFEDYGTSYSQGFYLIRTNSFGDTLWTKKIANGCHFEVYSVKQTNDEGYIICGQTEIPTPKAGILIKTDSLGNVTWSKNFESNANGLVSNILFSARQTNDNGYIVAGIYQEGVYLMKTDSMGNYSWAKKYYEIDSSWNKYATCIEQTIDNGYIIAGTIEWYTNNVDDYILKTDSIGDLEWSKRYGGPYDEKQYPNKQDKHPFNYTWVVPIDWKDGIIKGYAFTSKTSGIVLYECSEYLVRTDQYGNSGGCYEHNVNTIVTPVISVMNNIQLTVSSTSTIVSSAATIMKTPPSKDTLICSSMVGLFQVAPLKDGSINIYPNPAKDKLFIESSVSSEIIILNIIGQNIKNFSSDKKNYSIDISLFSKGVYFIYFKTDSEIKIRKFIKE